MFGGLFHGVSEELHGRPNYTWWGKVQALIVVVALIGIGVILVPAMLFLLAGLVASYF